MPEQRFGNSLLALSSAAVLAVYAAGYVRTRAAAERFATQTEARVRPAFHVAPAGGPRAAIDAAAQPAPALRAPEVPGAAVEPTHDAGAPAAATAHEPVRPRRRKTVEVVAPSDATLPVPSVPAPSAPTTLVTPPPLDTPSVPAPSAPAAQWRDGTYLGWGTSRHGDIQAQVIVEGGRIASATIAQCLTRYSCSVIAKLPPEVAQRQSPEVDYVSGATQSTNAFYYAVVEALSKAK